MAKGGIVPLARPHVPLSPYAASARDMGGLQKPMSYMAGDAERFELAIGRKKVPAGALHSGLLKFIFKCIAI